MSTLMNGAKMLLECLVREGVALRVELQRDRVRRHVLEGGAIDGQVGRLVEAGRAAGEVVDVAGRLERHVHLVPRSLLRERGRPTKRVASDFF